MRCRSCGKEFSVDQIADALDNDLEELLAGVRSDRV